MTIDECILDCIHYTSTDLCKYEGINWVKSQIEQLAEWLEELKDYRDKNKMVVRIDCNNIEDVKTISRAFVLACEEISNCGGGDVELVKEYFIEKAGASNGTDNQ